jgi:hypothetical protein
LKETTEIQALDEIRDNSYKILKESIKVASLNKNPEIQKSGIELKYIIDNYKKSNRKPYIENTAFISNMIQDLRKPPYKDCIELLNLTEAVENLSNDNNAFNEKYHERATEKYTKLKQGTMVDIRRKVDKAYNVLTNSINTVYLMDETQGYRELLAPIIDKINSYIEQYKLVYSRRLGGKKSKKKNLEMDDIIINIETNEVPNLLMTDQTLIGENTSVEGSAAQMTAMAVDPAAFASALYPAATNGVVRLKDATDAWTTFPIAGFLMDNEDQNPVGLILDPPTPMTAFIIPLNILNTQPGEIRINNRVLATIDGIGYPETITVD